MLCEDYFTYEKRADQSGGSPHCRSCSSTNDTSTNIRDHSKTPSESIIHILTECESYLDIRTRIFPQFSILCQQSKTSIDFEAISENKTKLCQFLLDPSSLNLDSRISMSDPLLHDFFMLSRDFCYAIHTTRMKILKQKASINEQIDAK